MSEAQNLPFVRERKLLGAKIKKLREERHMTQEMLSERSNINTAYLAKIENALVNTSVRLLIKIARGLHVDVKDLFDF